MNSVESVLLNGNEIFVYKSDIYIVDEDGKFCLQLDMIVSEKDDEDWRGTNNINVQFTIAETDKTYTRIMHCEMAGSDIPALYLTGDMSQDEFVGLEVIPSEEYIKRDVLEPSVTLKEIRKHRMPYTTEEFTLPIDQLEWLWSLGEDKDKVVEKAIYDYMNKASK